MSKAPLKESAARKAIDELLSHLGWVIDEKEKDCDVFTEGAKTKEQHARLKGNRPDYVLYEGKTDRPIAVVEAKRPGHGLTKAIEQAANGYAAPLDMNIVFASDGSLFQTFDRRSNAPLLLDGEPVVDLLPPKLLLQFANEGPCLVTPTKVLQTKQELMLIFAEANDLLRKEGLRAGIERFSEFSNFIFLKVDQRNRGRP